MRREPPVHPSGLARGLLLRPNEKRQHVLPIQLLQRGLFTEQKTVSAYVGSSKDLKDLKDVSSAHPTASSVSAARSLRAGKLPHSPRKEDARLPVKENSNSHGARPAHIIITMMWWIQTSRVSIKNSLANQCRYAACVGLELQRFQAALVGFLSVACFFVSRFQPQTRNPKPET